MLSKPFIKTTYTRSHLYTFKYGTCFHFAQQGNSMSCPSQLSKLKFKTFVLSLSQINLSYSGI